MVTRKANDNTSFLLLFGICLRSDNLIGVRHGSDYRYASIFRFRSKQVSRV
jgi:hypothetical protein